MSLNTTTQNKCMTHFDQHRELWLFGYGSLIFRPDFAFLARRPARIDGWTRRFWQGSHDHRGTERYPGRVATLVPQADAQCVGMAFLITPQVFEHLDIRERNGYLRFCTTLTFTDHSTAEGLVYIATEENAAFLGPAPEADIARHIAGAAGVSGPNSEYLLRLAESLRELEAEDEHVFDIERHLLAHSGVVSQGS